MAFELPLALYEEIVEHAREGLPNEACGVVAGDDGRPVRVYPMHNAEESPVVYRFEPNEQLEVTKEIEEKGWDLLAIFHSHTHTEAYPSPTDRAHAHWRDPITGEEAPAFPGTRYLILSLAEQEPVLRAFNWGQGDPVEEDVTIR
ncbi:MAG: M67 family metallopeptidase [Actinomycetota bacterium]